MLLKIYRARRKKNNIIKSKIRFIFVIWLCFYGLDIRVLVLQHHFIYYASFFFLLLLYFPFFSFFFLFFLFIELDPLLPRCVYDFCFFFYFIFRSISFDFQLRSRSMENEFINHRRENVCMTGYIYIFANVLFYLTFISFKTQ